MHYLQICTPAQPLLLATTNSAQHPLCTLRPKTRCPSQLQGCTHASVMVHQGPSWPIVKAKCHIWGRPDRMGLPKGGISHTLFLVRVASPEVWATMAGEAGEACENLQGAVHPRISSTDRLTKHSSLVAMAKSGYRRACIVAGDGRERYIIPVAGVCRGSLLFIRSALFSRPILSQPAQQESSRSAVNPATAAHRYYLLP